MKSLRLSVVAFAVLLAACGQVEPVLLTVGMPECTFQGSTSMREGEASLSLTLNGLGNARAVLVELTRDHTYSDLETHFNSSNDWENRPEWLRTVIDIELRDAQGIDGTEDSERLNEGEYAVVCIDLNTGTAQAASPLRVRS